MRTLARTQTSGYGDVGGGDDGGGNGGGGGKQRVRVRERRRRRNFDVDGGGGGGGDGGGDEGGGCCAFWRRSSWVAGAMRPITDDSAAPLRLLPRARPLSSSGGDLRARTLTSGGGAAVAAAAADVARALLSVLLDARRSRCVLSSPPPPVNCEQKRFCSKAQISVFKATFERRRVEKVCARGIDRAPSRSLVKQQRRRSHARVCARLHRRMEAAKRRE